MCNLQGQPLYINIRITESLDTTECMNGEQRTGWYFAHLFVCVEVLRPSQPNGVMSSAVSLPNHTFTGQA